MKKTAWLALISVLFLYVPTVSAEDKEEWDYQEVLKDQPAPYDGYLFSDEGMANTLAKVQTKLNLLKTEKDEELKRVKINLESIIKSKDVEISADKQMYQKQLEAKQNVINSYQNELMWSNIKLISAIIISATAGLVVGKLFIKN